MLPEPVVGNVLEALTTFMKVCTKVEWMAWKSHIRIESSGHVVERLQIRSLDISLLTQVGMVGEGLALSDSKNWLLIAANFEE